MGKKEKHLELIQGVINRMANNSFLLKGWAVTLVVGILALATKEMSREYFAIAYIPILTFWGLDSYYLFQERLYRSLYDNVRKTGENEIDYSLKITNQEFTNNSHFKCLFSKTELLFYMSLLIICTIFIKIHSCN